MRYRVIIGAFILTGLATQIQSMQEMLEGAKVALGAAAQSVAEAVADSSPTARYAVAGITAGGATLGLGAVAAYQVFKEKEPQKDKGKERASGFGSYSALSAQTGAYKIIIDAPPTELISSSGSFETPEEPLLRKKSNARRQLAEKEIERLKKAAEENKATADQYLKMVKELMESNKSNKEMIEKLFIVSTQQIEQSKAQLDRLETVPDQRTLDRFSATIASAAETIAYNNDGLKTKIESLQTMIVALNDSSVQQGKDIKRLNFSLQTVESRIEGVEKLALITHGLVNGRLQTVAETDSPRGYSFMSDNPTTQKYVIQSLIRDEEPSKSSHPEKSDRRATLKRQLSRNRSSSLGEMPNSISPSSSSPEDSFFELRCSPEHSQQVKIYTKEGKLPSIPALPLDRLEQLMQRTGSRSLPQTPVTPRDGD